MSNEKEYRFTIFVEKHQGAFVAHALEAGLVATSDDLNDIMPKMSRMLMRQIEFAEKNNNPSDIYHPCAKEVWDRFAAATHSGERCDLETSSRTVPVNHNRVLRLNQNAYAASC